MFEGLIANKLANKMMEEDLYKIVKRHAFWGALVMILPLFGFDWIVFCDDEHQHFSCNVVCSARHSV